MVNKLFFEFIGERIRQKRIEKGLTLDDLALKSGLRKKYLQKIESGKAYGLSTTKFFDIAEAMNVPAGILVQGWEEFKKSVTV